MSKIAMLILTVSSRYRSLSLTLSPKCIACSKVTYGSKDFVMAESHFQVATSLLVTWSFRIIWFAQIGNLNTLPFKYCFAEKMPILFLITSSVVVSHRLSCSTACEIFLDQGQNPCLLYWQADSLPLSHQGSPGIGLFRLKWEDKTLGSLFSSWRETSELFPTSFFYWGPSTLDLIAG